MHQKAKEGSFRYRTGGKIRLVVLEPVEGDAVVDVVHDRQGNQHVAISEERRHPSSSSERTSSAVTDRPTETCGMPRFVVVTSEPCCLRPSRMRSAMTSLIDRFASWAS